ncbi:MAG: TIGR03619 family F420-dependent LLM class oxidoreductase [Actinomycetes bacterium]
MRIGFAVPVSGPWATPDNQAEVARRAEDLGYHSLWTFQRLLYPVDDANPRWIPPYREVIDPLVSLGFLAGVTSRARLGVAVLNLPWFSPLLLAKQAAAVDVLSGGRLDLGIGLGWSREEYAATGVPFTGKGARAEEFLRCLHALWGEPPVSFDGELWQVPPSYVAPRPVQRPGPPVIVGGFAPAALERAGRLADGWVSSARADLSVIGKSVQTVKDAAAEAGRDTDALRFVCRGVVRLRESPGASDRRPLTGTLDEVRADLDDLAAQGITETFVDLNFDAEVGGPDADPRASMARAHEALEALAPGR